MRGNPPYGNAAGMRNDVLEQRGFSGSIGSYNEYGVAPFDVYRE